MRLAFALLIFLGAASAQAQDNQPKPEAAPAAPPTVSIQGYGVSDKACLEWNDGCRTCRRPETGETVCANIGIACQPTAVTCTRRREPAK
ncbi:MAG: hypothetical protein ACXWVE_10505 [Rhodoplanes sp.]